MIYIYIERERDVYRYIYKYVSDLDKLCARCRLCALGCAKPLRYASFFGLAHFASRKTKNYYIRFSVE